VTSWNIVNSTVFMNLFVWIMWFFKLIMFNIFTITWIFYRFIINVLEYKFNFVFITCFKNTLEINSFTCESFDWIIWFNSRDLTLFCVKFTFTLYSTNTFNKFTSLTFNHDFNIISTWYHSRSRTEYFILISNSYWTLVIAKEYHSFSGDKMITFYL